jgi:hypothetical protein
LAELQERPGWRQLNAVRNHRLIVLSEAITRPSPRLVDVIEQLAGSLYPSEFTADAALAGDLPANCRKSVITSISQPLFPFAPAGGRR